MPISQLNRPRNNQNWKQQRRYYINGKGQYSTKSFKKSSQGVKDFLLSLLKNKTFLKWFSIFSAAFLLILLIYISWLSRTLPNPNQLMNREVAQSTKIYDRSGETVLYEISGDEKRTLVNLNDIPDYVKQATIAMEDKDFYKHGGISIWGIVRGVIWKPLTGKGMQGGSTLTQQFIKNAVLTNERTVTRKLKEWILSYRVEKKFTKDEILQMYLNEIPYGSTAYGIEAASQRYFGKSVKDVNLAEAAILAALPQAPSRYSPYGSHVDELINRQHYILDLMAKQGYVTEAKAEAAKQYKLDFKKQNANITAPHFVMYVKELLADKYGEKMLEQDGLKIYTTLDLYKQQAAEEAIELQAEKNEKNYQATNASLVSIDPKTGEILAMVGSRDYFNEDIDGQVNIATSKRQPGSSIKPIIYATSFLKGYTPNTVLYDVVTSFSSDPNNPYEPHNYDSKEHGPVTMKKALAGSLNIPAVKTLYLAGINNVLNLAEDLGYSTFGDRDRFGLSLVLGGGEVKLLEHTNAYSAFAREGKMNPETTAILKVEDKNGKVIEEFKEGDVKAKTVLEPNAARMVNSILTDNSARAYIFGEQNYLTLGDRPVGAKTGTTNDYHDAWTIGYTPSIVTGVWVGNSDNKEMKRGADGSVVAAPIWHNYMQKVLGDTPVENFNAPEIKQTGKPVLDGQVEGGEVVKIDRATGLLATSETPESFIEEKTFKQPHSILYYVDKDNPTGPKPEHPENDPQFQLWESAVLRWAGVNGTVSNENPPTESDNLHTQENKPNVKIITPGNNETITEPLLAARIEASAPRGINRAEYYIDGNLFAINYNYPYNLSKQADVLSSGFHNLKARVCDDVDNCAENSIEINLVLPKEAGIGDINENWVEPSGDLNLNSSDFPLNLKLQNSNPSQTARVEIYAATEGNKSLITSLWPDNNDTIAGVWKKSPGPGTYEVYAQAYGWKGQSAQSNPLKITVNE